MEINDTLWIKAKFFSGLSDKTRLEIIETLIDGEKSVNEIVALTKQQQPNVSNHLKCLDECGLVKSRRDGKFMYYSLSNASIKSLLKTTDKILKDVTDRIIACKE